jgi:hypothetical protein
MHKSDAPAEKEEATMKSRIQESEVRIQNKEVENHFCFYSGFWILDSGFCF